jgi:hypothetical protein
MDIHEDNIEILRANRINGLLTVIDNNDPMSTMRQQRQDQSLIGQIILGNKDVETSLVPVLRHHPFICFDGLCWHKNFPVVSKIWSRPRETHSIPTDYRL